MILELYIAFIVLSLPHTHTPTHPHTHTPTHPHTLTPSQYYRTVRRRALEATHPDYYSSKRRGSGSATPTSSTPVRPMFTLYAYVIASKHLNNLCVKVSLFCGESEKNENTYIVKNSVFVCMYKIVYVIRPQRLIIMCNTSFTCACQEHHSMTSLSMTSSFIHPGVPISPPPE